MRVLVTGASGFVGRHVVEELRRRGHEAVGTSRHDPSRPVDLALPGEVESLLASCRPDGVVHCAAVPDIAPCRDDPAAARRLNVGVSGELARGCAARGARLVHVSTDQVFDGSRGGWREDDEARPLSEYGRSKLAGELAVASGHPGAVILRPGLVTGEAPEGRRSSTSGLLAALALASAGQAARPSMFVDEVRSPVAVVDVARALVDLLDTDVSGRLHCGGPEALSRHELALREARLRGIDPSWVGQATRDAAGPGLERPADASLDSSRLVALLGWAPRTLAPLDCAPA